METWNDLKLVWRLFIVVAVIIILGLGLYLVLTQTLGVEIADAKREVFEHTQAYTGSMASFLAKEYKEYKEAVTDVDQKTIMNYVIMRYPNIDVDTIDNKDLKNFYNLCLNGGE